MNVKMLLLFTAKLLVLSNLCLSLNFSNTTTQTSQTTPSLNFSSTTPSTMSLNFSSTTQPNPSSTLRELRCFNCIQNSDKSEVEKSCDEDEPTFDDCRNQKTYVNWPDIEHKDPLELTEKCIRVVFKRASNPKEQIALGCIGVYKNYDVCRRMKKILAYQEEIVCKVCDTELCNFEPKKLQKSGVSIFFLQFRLLPISLLFLIITNKYLSLSFVRSQFACKKEPYY